MIFFGDFLLLNLSYFQKSLVSLENQTTMLKLFYNSSDVFTRKEHCEADLFRRYTVDEIRSSLKIIYHI